jgi:proteasome activator subunit 3 (PA28 gamma)
LATKAKKIINEEMPQKIFTLNDFLKTSELFNVQDLSIFHQPIVPKPDTTTVNSNKKRKIDESESKTDSKPIVYTDHADSCHPHLFKCIDFLKSEIEEVVSLCNTVKIYIQLNIPKIEDGNNFGVSIQEEVVKELSSAEDSAFAVLDSISKYYMQRAKLVTKVMKYPHVKDYQYCIWELDEKEYTWLRLTAIDIRNNYAMLYDLIQKNFDRIEKPRQENAHAALY